jgi:hypothetical protein
MSNDLPVPVSRYAQLAGREIHWLEWGAPDAPVIIAWHGRSTLQRAASA